MPTLTPKQIAAQVVSQFSHYESGIEWVTNPNPEKLRETIEKAIEADRQDRVDLPLEGTNRSMTQIVSDDLGPRK